jgi:hydroxyethylthiazole kinase-like uncharacterized protein yjeF
MRLYYGLPDRPERKRAVTAARLRPLTRHTVTDLLPPPRPRDSHKGDFGRVIVIGGDSGMVGAALLAGRAALLLGAGAVHVGLLAENAPLVDAVQPELMLHSAADCLNRPASVVALGCGLGQGQAALTLLREALALESPLVLDADALNLLAAQADLRTVLAARQAATVLTPHPGEAARLLGCSSADIQANRPAVARRLAQTFNCALVLKGADSLCATRDGLLYRNETGNPGMSAPGMGDVLSGMIAAFIAQGSPADDALLLAVHLHGAAGDALAREGLTLGMTASELTTAARRLYNALQSV